jgi:hypothetical protein
MATVQSYAVIATAAGTIDGQTVVAGQVVNVVLWDGVTPWTPPAGTETRADPTGSLQIGQIATV